MWFGGERAAHAHDAAPGPQICWVLPVLLAAGMMVAGSMNDVSMAELFHEDIHKSELQGIGWCGVRSMHRLIKGAFINTPQLLLVSLYAQLYIYALRRAAPPAASHTRRSVLGVAYAWCAHS